MAKVTAVSPLAPPGGFPDLPVIGGVRFATAEAGVKYRGRTDVMLAEIAPGSVMAGAFTRSSTRAAPVLWCEEALKRAAAMPEDTRGFAIVVNSGNANAFTGGAGRKSAEAVARAAGKALGLPARRVLLSSTGVIGQPLPHERICAKLGEMAAGLSDHAAEAAARAIMTTDTFAKGSSAAVRIGDAKVRIAGFAKGSGMIAPDMATMLVYLFTDAAIRQDVLQAMVSAGTDATFNCITVDSDTSTSDTLLVAATGRAGNHTITRRGSPEGRAFEAALTGVMLDLAHQVVRDGEGATKFVTVEVAGAASSASARKVALAIANSPLVKTAIAGQDPNWGRIVMAVGKSGEPANRDRLSIRFGEILVADKGWVAPSYREEDGAAAFRREEISIRVDLGIGRGRARVWTCDLTHQYITINADYRS
jgi:glutamate N-acetyltransferase/amino-acid N-acetyltransferase